MAQQHQGMMLSLTELQTHVEGDESRDADAAAKLDQLIEQMRLANQMMAAVPSQRDQQMKNQEAMLRLLDEISVGIQQLQQELKGCSVR